MAGFSAQLDPAITGPQPIPGDEPGEFSKGLRSGFLGAGSQLQSFAGGTGRAMGFDQFAANRDAAARQLQEEAQAAGPRVGSYRDVGSLRDAVDYGLGVAGQAVPSVAAGVGAGAAVGLTGGGAIPALLAGAATQFPLEAGDVFQRQQLDPASQGRGAGENLLRAYGGGGASALGQAIVPAGFGGKLVGAGVKGVERAALKEGVKTAETGVSKGMLRQAFGAGVKDALIEGGSEGGGEVVKQYATNDQAPIDWQQVGENALAGAVVGAPLGAGGHLAEGFHENKAELGQGIKDLAGKAKEAGKSALQGAKEGAAGTAAEAYSGTSSLATKAGEVASEVGSKLKGKGAEYLDAFNKAREGNDQLGDELAAGSPIAGASPEERDVLASPTADPAAKQNVLTGVAAKTKAWMQKTATGLANNLDLDDSTRQKAADVAQGVTDAGSAAWVATQNQLARAKAKAKQQLSDIGNGLQSVKDHYKGNKAGVDDFLSQLNEAAANGSDMSDIINKTADEKGPGWKEKLKDAVNIATGKARKIAQAALDAVGNDEGVKKSEEYNPEVRQKILESIEGKVPTHVAEDPKLMEQLGNHLRNFATDVSGDARAGDMEDAVALFRPFFGSDTYSVLSGVMDAVHGSDNPEATANFFKNAANFKAGATATESLENTIRNALPPEKERQVRGITDVLVKWAEGRGEGLGDKADAARNRAKHQEFLDAVKREFGNRAESVLDAVNKHVEDERARRLEQSFSNEGNRADADFVDEGSTPDANPKEAKPEETQTLFAGRYVKSDAGERIPVPMMNPDLQDARAPEGETGSTRKELEKQKAAHPGQHVEWVSEHDEKGSGSRTHGFIKVSDAPKEGEMTVAHIRNAMLDTEQTDAQSHASGMTIAIPESKRSQYGIKSDTLSLDAVKLARQGRNAAQRATGSDQQSDVVRLARGFFNAYAQLSDTFGVKPKLPHGLDTVIGYNGKEKVTLGDATKLDMRTKADVQSDADMMRTLELRKELQKKNLPYADKQEMKKELFELEIKRKASIQENEESPLQQTERRLQDAMAQLGAIVNTGKQGASGDAQVRLAEIDKRLSKLSASKEYTEESRREMNALSQERRKMLNVSIKDLPNSRDLPLRDRALKLDEQVTKLRERRDELEHQDRLKDNLTTDGPEGRTELGKDEQIHRVVAEHGNEADDEALNVRESDTAALDAQREAGDTRERVDPGQKTSQDLANAPRDAKGNILARPQIAQPMKRDGKPWLLAAEQLIDSDKPVAQNVGKSLKALTRNIDALSEADYNKLRDVMNKKERTVGSIGQTIADLAGKYKAILAKPPAEPSGLQRPDMTGPLEAPGAAERTPGAPVRKGSTAAFENAMGSQKLRETGAFTDAQGRELDAEGKPVGPGGGDKPRARQLGRTAADNAAFDERNPELGDPNRPKAVAAKKAALDKAASSSDPALLQELSTTGNMTGLGKTAEYLATQHPDSEAARVAGESYDRATHNQNQSYEGVKLSVQSQRIHDEMGNPGFAATHDSPGEFSGEFDWRTHALKGEGAMVKGAGTYLSTAEGVHKSYKDQFTAQINNSALAPDDVRFMPHIVEAGNKAMQAWQNYNDAESHHSWLDEQHDQAQAMRNIKNWTVHDGGAEFWTTDSYGSDGLMASLDHVPEMSNVRDSEGDLVAPGWYSVDRTAPQEYTFHGDTFAEARESLAAVHSTVDTTALTEARNQMDSARNRAEMLDAQYQALIDKEMGKNVKGGVRASGKSPTYEVSVDIPQEHILDWDKPISEQSQHVQDALAKLGYKDNPTGERLEWDNDNGTLTAFNAYDTEYSIAKDSGGYTLSRDGNYMGSYSFISEAKNAAQADQGMVDAMGKEFYEDLSNRLGGDRQASDALQDAGIPAMKHNSGGGKNSKFPNYVVIDDSKIQTNYVHFSQQQQGQGTGPSTMGQSAADALAYLHKVLGNSIQVDMTKYLGHAGDWNPAKDLVRISANMLNKKSIAYHESLHAFFTQLYRSGNPKIAQVLMKAAGSQHVQQQLQAYFKNEPRVLAAMKADPEEAAAYMYQLWSQGDLKMNPQATTIFGKIAEFIRSVLGIWSNDKRALEIMEHFSSGEYAKNIGKPNTVALLQKGTNPAIEAAKAMFSPATDMGEKIFASGNSRLRDTGVPALSKIADLVKKKLIDKGDDVGFLSAAREERAWRMNQLANDLGHLTEAEQMDALKDLQGAKAATTPEGKAAVAVIRKYLDDMYKYITVDGKQQMDKITKDYFPRVWDPDVISKNQTAFLGMIEKYVQAGMYKGNPQELLRTLTTNDGNDFNVDTRRPGFQSAKERGLHFISGADAEPFLSKNLHETLNNYTSQATRRVEFGKRFGADGEQLTALLKQAKREGATDEQLKSAETFMKGVTGTLGDGINPQARRMMGNMVVYQNLRLLPLAIFSSVVDPLGIAVRGGTIGDAYKAMVRGFKEMPKSFKDSGSKDWQTDLAETLGVIDNASLMHAVGAMYTQGMVSNTARKWNDTLFRFNLMEQYNRSMRVAATEASLKFMQRHAAGANAHSARYLAELGLKKSDIQVDPATGRVRVTEADGLTPEQADRMRTAVNQWVDGAVLRPDNADRPTWFNDPHFMLLSHLKSFTYAFHHTIIDRVMHEAAHGNYQPMAVMASYVPVMIAADYMKGMIQGGGEQPAWKRDWGPGDYLWSGVQRGGLLGVGQFGADVGEGLRRGGSGIGALAGPTFDQLGDAIDVAGGRERFGKFALDSMPANSLYAGFIKGHEPARDPTFAE